MRRHDDEADPWRGAGLRHDGCGRIAALHHDVRRNALRLQPRRHACEVGRGARAVARIGLGIDQGQAGRPGDRLDGHGIVDHLEQGQRALARPRQARRMRQGGLRPR
jgi:hypothetical protein